METITEKTSKVLKDLIVINNDRYEGYKIAAEKVKDTDLKTLFTKYSEQSRKFGQELQDALPDKNHGSEQDTTSTSGKLYRAWMDMKAVVTDNNSHILLSSCEFGEDKTRDAYEDALKNIADLSRETQDKITNQSLEIKKAHDNIKSLRDTTKS